MSAALGSDEERAAFKEGWDERGEIQKVVARKAFPSLYALLYPAIVEAARPLGYAIALHGSMGRDLDLIAVPWVEDAAAPADLVAAISDQIGAFVQETKGGECGKPHGRLGFVLHLTGGAYIDLAIMPRIA